MRSERRLSRMREAFITWLQLSMRRVRARYRTSVVLLVGAFLAVGFAAAAPIYLQSIRDLGLTSLVESADPADLDLKHELTISTGPKPIAETEDLIDAEVRALESRVVLGSSASLQSPGFVVEDPELDSNGNVVGPTRALFTAQAGFEDLVVPRDGEALEPWDGEDALPAWITTAAAEHFQLDIGDAMMVQPFWLTSPVATTVRILGLFDPLDADDPRWVGRLRVGEPRDDFGVSFWIPRESLFALAEASPQMRSSLNVVYFTDAASLNGDAADSLASGLEVFETRLAQQIPNLRIDSDLPELLREFDDRFAFAESTLLVIVLELVAVLLLYLAIASAMVSEQGTEDYAWLRSRGASQRGIAAIQMVETALLTVPPVVVAPFVGLGLVSLLGFVPPFDELSEGSFVPVRLSAVSWYLALVAGGLAIAAQFIPALMASKSTVVTARRARSRPPTDWRSRVVVDVIILVLAALLIFELRRDSSTAVEAGASVSLDLLSVATPAILLFAFGLVVLRAFPLAMRSLSRLLAALQPTTALLTSVYLGRAPTHYGRVLLIMLVVGTTAVFAASFKATLTQSYDDRAEYTAGADIRLVDPVARSVDVPRVAAQLEQANGDGEEEAVIAAVSRLDGRLTGDAQATTLSILMVDASAFGEVAKFRDDFSSQSLEEALPGLVAQGGSTGPIIPVSDGSIGVWVRYKGGGANTGLLIRIRDEVGQYFEYGVGFLAEVPREDGEQFVPPNQPVPLQLVNGAGEVVAGPDDLDAWYFLERSLRTPNTEIGLQGRRTPGGFGGGSQTLPLPRGEVQIISFSLIRLGRRADVPGEFLVDDLTWIGPDGPVVLDDFDEPGRWEAIPPLALQPPQERLVLVEDDVVSGAALSFEWSAVSANFDAGFRPLGSAEPLAVLISDGLLERSGVRVGEVTQVNSGNVQLEVLVTGTFDYFPTFDPDAGTDLVIIDQEALVGDLLRGASAGSRILTDDEVWARSGAVSDNEFLAMLGVDPEANGVFTASAERAEIEADPLIVAGWNGLFAASLVAVGIAAAFGMTILALLTVQARRLEFAVLRSLGLGVRQLLAIVLLEQLTVVVLGLGLGLLLGTQAGPILLDLFALTPDGRDVLPPLIFAIDWSTLGLVLAAIVGILFINMLGVLAFLWRLELQSALRAGQ